jgi:hypothetical protein
MKNLDEVLKLHLIQEITLEEELCRIIEEQILELKDTDSASVKNTLLKTKQLLEHHFSSLNELLDQLEAGT